VEQLFTAIPGLFDRLPENPELRRAIVDAIWKKEAGSGLQSCTKAIGLNGTTLKVAVPDEAWCKHLAELSGQLIFAVNRRAGRKLIERIEFVIDTSVFPEKQRVSTEPEAGPSDDAEQTTDDKELTKAATSIKDPKLRELVLRTAAYSKKRRSWRRQ
jgi:hypothetical protein